jgi:pyrroloquinoline quinone biosynthesis protein B
VAVSADGQRWWLLNASPDILAQIQATPALWPRDLRHSPIAGVVLTNGDLDHVLGLLLLRESQPFSVYATARVMEGLRQNVFLRTLERFPEQVCWRNLEPNRTTELLDTEEGPSGLELTPFPLPGKPPLHLMQAFPPSAEDNLGLRLQTRESSPLVYASAIGGIPDPRPFEQAGAWLIDGTFWSEEELPGLGVPMGPARSMAHLPISGEQGSLRRLAAFRVPQRFYTHVNNTNPILDVASAEHASLRGAGWQVASDGMRLSL